MAMKSFLGPGFKASQCKTYLRLAISRINLLRNKRNVQITKLRKEIAQLLRTGQESSASIQVENVIREQNVIEAYDVIQQFAELVALRLPIIDSQKDCPLDLKEGISSLIFAAPRCSDLTELPQASAQFQSKYGENFITAATELHPGCGVNRTVIDKLSVKSPTSEAKFKLLKEIAAEHDVEWNAISFEEEIIKVHEDLLEGPRQFTSAHDMPISEQSSSIQTQMQNLSHQSTQSISPNPSSLPDTFITHIQSTTPVEAPSDVTRRLSHDKNVLGNGNFGSPPNQKSEVTQSQDGKSAESMRGKFDGAQATPVLDQKYEKEPTGTSFGMSGQIGVQAHYHDEGNAAEGAMVEADRAVAAINAAISFASKGRSSQSADSANDQSRMAHPQNKTRIGMDRDSTFFFDDESVYKHRESEDAGERDAWPLKGEGPQETNSSARTSKSICKYTANDLLGSAQKDVEEEPHEGLGKHNTKLLTAAHKKGASLEIFDMKEDISQGFIVKKVKQERIAGTFVDNQQQFREPGFEEDTIQESTSMQSRQRKNPDSVVNHQRRNEMHDEYNLVEQVQEHHDPLMDIEGSTKGDQRRKTKSLVDDTGNSHQEGDPNRILGRKGSDKANLNDDEHYRSGSNSPHKARIGETHAETFHDSIYSRKKPMHPVEEHHKWSPIQSLGIGEDQGPQWDELPKKGTTKSTKPQQDTYYDHDRAPLWNDEPHEGVRVSDDWYHKSKDVSLDSGQRKTKTKTKLSQTSYEMNHDHDRKSVSKVDSWNSAAGMRFKSKADNSQEFESPKLGGRESHVSPFGDVGACKAKIFNIDVDEKRRSQSSDSFPVFDEPEDDILASRQKGKGSIAKPVFDEFYKGENTRYTDDPGFNKGIRLGGADSEQLKSPRTSKYIDKVHNYEETIPSSTSRSKQEWPNEKTVRRSSQNLKDLSYPEGSKLRKGVNWAGGLPHEMPKHQSRKARDTSSGYDDLSSFGEIPSARAVTIGGKDVRPSKTQEDEPYVGMGKQTMPRVHDDPQIRRHGEEFPGKKESKKLAKSRLNDRNNGYGDDWEGDPLHPEESNIHPGLQGDSSRLKQSGALESQGKKSERKKQLKSQLQVQTLDDDRNERWSPNTAAERDVSRHLKEKITNPSEYNDQSPPLQANLSKLKVGKPISSVDGVPNHAESRTPGGRPSRAPKVEKSPKVVIASHHEIPLPAATREKSKLAGEPSYADSQTKQKSDVEPQQRSVAKDEGKASVKPVVPVSKVPPNLTGGASSPSLPKQTSAGGASTPRPKLVVPPDYADFVANFKPKSKS